MSPHAAHVTLLSSESDFITVEQSKVPYIQQVPDWQADNVMILREVNARVHNTFNKQWGPARATKVHTQNDDGRWSTEGYNIDAKASAHPHTVRSLRAFMDVLVSASDDPLNYLVGDVVAPDQNPARLRRAVNKRADGALPGLAAHPHGLQWICWEVDKVAQLPPWFDPTSADRSRDADFVRWWIRKYLPPQFHDRSAVLQWSASALLGGRISMHVWQWLTKPVARKSIHTYFQAHKAKWKDILDIGVYGGARVHYIATPRFRAASGAELPDPLAGWRWQWVQGEAGDACEPLDAWCDQPTLDAREVALFAKRHAKATVHQAATEKVHAARRIARLDRPRGRHPTLTRGADFDPIACTDEASARACLAQYVAQIEALTEADAKHVELCSVAMRAAVKLRGILSEDEIRAVLEGVAVQALVHHGDRSRAPDKAQQEVQDLLDSAFAKAHARGVSLQSKAIPDFAAVGAQEILDQTPHEEVLEEPAAQVIRLDEDQAALDLAAFADIEADAHVQGWGVKFIDARAELCHLIREAITEGGKWAVKASAGLGKSYAICEALVAHRKTQRVTAPVTVAAPSLALAHELKDQLRARGADAIVAVTRTKANCERFGELTAAQKLAPDGSKRLCASCPHHPKNAGSTDACPFWRAFSAQGQADFICGSHALEALKGRASHPTYLEALPVAFDWESFTKLPAGLKAVPWVRRCEQHIVISARVSDTPTASPPPTPTLSDHKRWTAESKRAFIEWTAQAWGCDPTREAILQHAAQRAQVPHETVRIDWAGVSRLAGSEGRFVPALRPCGGSTHLTVEAAPQGAPLPEIGFTDTPALTAESKAALRAWVCAVWGVSELADYARQHLDEWPLDALIIDESPLHVMRMEGTLSLTNLAELKCAGELTGPGVDDLMRLVWQSEQAKKHSATKNTAKHEGSPTRWFISDQLAAQVGAMTVATTHQSAAKRLGEALNMSKPDRRLTHLQGGWSWEALEALHVTSTSGWRGAFIQDGLLHVAAPRRLDMSTARTVVALDATMTPSQARASLGDDVRFRKVGLSQNPYLEVIHVPVDLGPRASAWGDANGPFSKRNAYHFLAAAQRWGGPDSVLFLHKWILHTKQCWLTPHLDGIGEVTYHGSTQSRGSNRWRDLSTCVMTGHHVPRAIKRQQAELLAMMCGTDYADDPAKWDAEASWLLEGGAVVQELSRIRPLEASASAPKRLVLLDRRAPEAFGFKTTTAVDPDLLAWQELRALPALCDVAEGQLRTDVMAAVVSDVLDALGGILPLGGAGVGVGVGVGACEPISSPVTERVKGALAHFQDLKDTPTPRTLSDRIHSWMYKRFPALHDFAASVGCALTEVVVWGRRPVAFLHRPTEPMPMSLVESYLAQLGVRAYRDPITGERRGVGTLDGTSEQLSKGLWDLTRAQLEGERLGSLYDLIATRQGVTPRTVCHWIAAHRLDGEDNRTCLLRIWAALQAYRIRDVIADALKQAAAQGPVSEVYIEAVVEAVCASAQEGGWGCAPWEVRELVASIQAADAEGWGTVPIPLSEATAHGEEVAHGPD